MQSNVHIQCIQLVPTLVGAQVKTQESRGSAFRDYLKIVNVNDLIDASDSVEIKQAYTKSNQHSYTQCAR